MNTVNIAIVGATGMVGRKFIEVLEESSINIKHLYLYSSFVLLINFGGLMPHLRQYFYVSGNADRTPDQLPNHNILPLFQFQ